MKPMYEEEILDSEVDDGTIKANINQLAEAVVGHRIVSAERVAAEGRYYSGESKATVITLDNGDEVVLADTTDCCAFTFMEQFLLEPSSVDHVIMGVGTTEQCTVWHIYADFGDIMRLQVGWSCGNPFYYGYGFDIRVQPAPKPPPPPRQYPTAVNRLGAALLRRTGGGR